MVQKYYVQPTIDRSDCGSTYNVRMSRSAAKRAFGSLRPWPRLVVLSRNHREIEDVDSLRSGPVEVEGGEQCGKR